MKSELKQENQKSFTLRWCAGSISITSAAVFVSYVTYFCTDVGKMDATLVGILILVSKIFDGITDLIAGFIVDHTHTKWGKGRPYNFSVAIVWLLTIALYAMPDMSSTWKAIYIFTVYTLISSVFTTLQLGSEPVYFRRATETTERRTKILSYNGALGAFFIILLSILLPVMVDAANDTREGWILMSVILAVPMIALGLVRVLTIKEVNNENDDLQHNVSILESIRVLSGNKYIFLIGAVNMINMLVNSMSTVNTYYFTYIYGNLSQSSVVGLVALASPLVIAFFPAISKRLGAKSVVQLGFACGILGGVIRFFAGANLPLLIIGNIFFTLSLLPMQALLNLFVIECMDYTLWKSGKEINGVVSSVAAFFNKIGSALASGIIGLVMGIAGYNGALSVQSPSAINAIVFLYAGVPLILSIVSLILLHFYDLDKKIDGIREELTSKSGIKG